MSSKSGKTSSNSQLSQSQSQSHDHQHYSNQEEDKTFMWWTCLRNLALVNIMLWYWTYDKCSKQQTQSNTATATATATATTDNSYSYSTLQMYLSLVYVLVCAYRSMYPRIDLERYTLFDTKLSSIFLGRFAATIAEICFSCQLALLLNQIDQLYIDKYFFMVPTTSSLIVPTITIAQMCCWAGVVTLDCIWHVIEESIWAVCSLLICTCFGSIFLATSAAEDYDGAATAATAAATTTTIQKLCTSGIPITLAYFAFMALVDVPMYITKRKEYVGSIIGKDSESKKKKSTAQSLKDTWSRRICITDWNFWKKEAPWLTGYFSCAVWISISLIHISLSLEQK